MNQERRKAKRWDVSIPCSITHTGEPIRGRITDVSMGGVFITELTGLIPPEGALITVQCQVEDQEIEIKASVDSSVAHSLSNIRSDETVKSIGVKFQDHSQKGHSRHDFVLLLISAS